MCPSSPLVLNVCIKIRDGLLHINANWSDYLFNSDPCEHVRGVGAMLCKTNEESSHRGGCRFESPWGAKGFPCRNASSPASVGLLQLLQLPPTCIWVIGFNLPSYASGSMMVLRWWGRVQGVPHILPRLRDSYVCLIAQSTVSGSASSLPPVWIPPAFI